LEQLLPQPGPLERGDVYADLRLTELAPADRPYVIANMVASVDGRATIAARSGGLGNETDREIFLDLRTQTDAVMAGTATIGLEGYGPLVRSAGRRDRRRQLGLDEVPLAVTATRSMELPVQTPLFQDPGSRIVVLTSSERPAPPCPGHVVVENVGPEPLDFVAGMKRLRSGHGVRSLLLEGGPTLLAAMVADGVVDELFLTRSPKLVGSGDEPSIMEGPPLSGPLDLELLSLLHEDGYTYARYRLGRSVPESS
jgi:riboflavin biosynthesis pyrimidine reductase